MKRLVSVTGVSALLVTSLTCLGNAASRFDQRLPIDKQIVHVHRTVAEVDAAYSLAVGLQGSIGESLDQIASSSSVPPPHARVYARPVYVEPVYVAPPPPVGFGFSYTRIR